MAENNTEKQRVQELTDKLEQGLQDLSTVTVIAIILARCQNFIIIVLTTRY